MAIAKTVSPLLVAEGLAKKYGSLSVLADASLSLHAGECVAIVGASGSGKTTLLSLLAGLDKPDAGSLLYGDQKLSNYSETELARWRGRHIGIVFQDYHLVPSLTAWENVALPLEIASAKNRAADLRSQAMAILQSVGLSERAQHFPHQLSGGEQQRVALARALVGKPDLLFADEPTGNLDEVTAREVEDLLFDLIRKTGLAAILVTHNRELAKRCDRILNLHFGRFVA